MLTLAARSLPAAAAVPPAGVATVARGALAALRSRAVLRWLALLAVADLMVDVLGGFLGLYLVDAAGMSIAGAALSLAAWRAAGLAGDGLPVAALARVS
jgi:hypothetical protein